jgi:tetratricopeptide (TPR) repeat protein
LTKFNNHYSFSGTHILLIVFGASLFFACNSSKKITATTPVQAEKRIGSSHVEEVISSKNLLRFEYNFYNANTEKILGNYDQALRLYLTSLDANPKSAAAMYEVATILEQKQNFQQALHYSKKAAMLDADNIWYQELYINCLKENRRWQEVINAYQNLIKKRPNDIEYYYELANTYLLIKKTDEAFKIFDDLEKRFGFNKDISLQKISVFQITHHTDKAIEETKKLIKDNPNEPSYYGILGDLYQDKGESSKAFDAYKKMLDADPDNPYVHISLANYYSKQKQDSKAFEETIIAFKSKDLDIDTKIKMLMSYYYTTATDTQFKTDADTLCKIVVQVHPNEAKAYAIYGDFLYRDKKPAEARIQYRKAIELDKEKYALWNQLLVIDSELSDNEALLKDSKDAIELFPTQPLPYLLNGVTNLQFKNYNEAVTSLNMGKDYVLDNQGLLSQFYGYLGDAYYQLKNYTESDFAFDNSLKADKNNIVVLNNYAYYLSLRNVNLEKAEAMSKRSNDLDPDNSSYQDTYGWVLYKMGKYNDAKIWIGKAIANLSTINGTLQEHYGDILYKMGDTENAVKYWENAKKTGEASDVIDKKIADKKLYE